MLRRPIGPLALDQADDGEVVRIRRSEPPDRRADAPRSGRVGANVCSPTHRRTEVAGSAMDHRIVMRSMCRRQVTQQLQHRRALDLHARRADAPGPVAREVRFEERHEIVYLFGRRSRRLQGVRLRTTRCAAKCGTFLALGSCPSGRLPLPRVVQRSTRADLRHRQEAHITEKESDRVRNGQPVRRGRPRKMRRRHQATSGSRAKIAFDHVEHGIEWRHRRFSGQRQRCRRVTVRRIRRSQRVVGKIEVRQLFCINDRHDRAMPAVRR